jgi:hypothetical protein
MTRATFRRQYREARLYIRDKGSCESALFWFHGLAPQFSMPAAKHSIPHRLPSGRIVLRLPPVVPAGDLP